MFEKNDNVQKMNKDKNLIFRNLSSEHFDKEYLLKIYLWKEYAGFCEFFSFEIFYNMSFETAADIPISDQSSSTGIYQTTNTHPGIKKSHQTQTSNDFESNFLYKNLSMYRYLVLSN